MSGHVQEELAAFYDGQLHGAQQRRVFAHLETCAECRAELAQIERLGALLKSSSIPETRLPPERFAAQVRLRLQLLETPARRRHHWVIPALLVGAWAFVQAIVLMSSGLLILGSLGVGKQAGLTWLLPTGGLNLGQILQAAEQGMHGLLPLFSLLTSTLLSVLIPLALFGAIGILFWAWWFGWRRYNMGK